MRKEKKEHGMKRTSEYTTEEKRKRKLMDIKTKKQPTKEQVLLFIATDKYNLLQESHQSKEEYTTEKNQAFQTLMNKLK